MADKFGNANGSGPRQDQTTQPGQYPSHLPFGFPVPQSTGAPGTSGQGGTATDPTMESPTPSSVFGMPADNMHTGSPGSAGATPGSAGGLAYTDPFAYLAGGTAGQMSGGSSETEAQANKTGYPTPFGMANPLDTGAGKGSPMIGGNTNIHKKG